MTTRVRTALLLVIAGCMAMSSAVGQTGDSLEVQLKAVQARAKHLRKEADARLPLEQKPCYQRFQVNACLDEAKARNQQAHKEAAALERQANALQRQLNAEQQATRRKQLAEKEHADRERAEKFRVDRAQAQADAQSERQSKDASATAQASDRAAQAAAKQQTYDAKAAKIDAKLRKRAEERQAKEARAAEKAAIEKEAEAAREARRAEQRLPFMEKLKRLFSSLIGQ